MDETTSGGRQLTAAEANALAQELDDRAAGREPGSDTTIPTENRGTASGPGPSPEATAAGSNPLEGEEREARAGVFPPDVAPAVDIGDSPEERAQLSDEYRQDDEYRRSS
jgi:hypothetical protein